MDTIDKIVGISGMILMTIIVAGAFVYRAWQKNRLPNSWIHKGEPPPDDVDLALEVILMQLDKWPERWGGEITWIDGPFMVPGSGMNSIQAAGCVDDFWVPKIRLMWFKDVEKTALAHELCHVFNQYPDGDPRLDEFVNKTNQLIAARRKIRGKVS